MNDRLYQAVIDLADETGCAVTEVTAALVLGMVLTYEEEEQIDIRAGFDAKCYP